jgi:hypothetical protein
MPRFRVLSPEELEVLELEFKQFLIVNHLHDKEWRELAENQPEKAQEFIELFSDIVLEKAYAKCQALVQFGLDFIAVFMLDQEVWQLFHFQIPEQLMRSIRQDNWLENLVQNLDQIKLQKGTKKPALDKVSAVHQLCEKGAKLMDKADLIKFNSLFLKQ